jgi:hypothetical protein
VRVSGVTCFQAGCEFSYDAADEAAQVQARGRLKMLLRGEIAHPFPGDSFVSGLVTRPDGYLRTTVILYAPGEAAGATRRPKLRSRARPEDGSARRAGQRGAQGDRIEQIAVVVGTRPPGPGRRRAEAAADLERPVRERVGPDARRLAVEAARVAASSTVQPVGTSTRTWTVS